MIGVFDHLVPTCSPCEAAAREAAANNLGVGAVDPASLVTTAGGVPVLKPDASQALLLLLGSRYPQMSGSGYVKNGQAVTTPGLDPAADYQTLVAAQQGSGLTVYEQLKTLPNGAVALFDFQSVVSNLNGTPTDIPYAIAKDAATAKTLAPQAQLVGLSTGASSEASATKSSSAPIIGGVAIGAGAMLLTGNPLVGVAAGVVSGFVLAKVA